MIGPWDHSYAALRKTRECIIAVPSVNLASKVVDNGNCSGAEVDKFTRFHLKALSSREVQAPSIAECLANIECRIADDSL